MPKPDGLPNDKGIDTKETETSNSDTPNNDPGSKGEATNNVPHDYESLKKSHQEAQKMIKEYKRKEQEALDQKKLEDDKKLEEQGQFDQLKNQWNTEKEAFTSQVTTLTDENTSLKATIQKMADDKLATAKEQLGEEKFEKVKKLIGSEDAQVILDKLPSIVELIGVEQKPVSGGTKLPNGDGKSDIDAILQKREKGEKLTKEEKARFLAS